MPKIPEKRPVGGTVRISDDKLRNLRVVLHNEDVRVYRMYADAGDTLKHRTTTKERGAGGSPDSFPHRTSVVTKGRLRITCRADDGTIAYQEERVPGDLKRSFGNVEGEVTFEALEDDTQWHCVLLFGVGNHVSTYFDLNHDKRVRVAKRADRALIVVFEGVIRVDGVEYEAPFSLSLDPDEAGLVETVTPARGLVITVQDDPDSPKKAKK